jgi:SpoIID/LytB domain protein
LPRGCRWSSAVLVAAALLAFASVGRSADQARPSPGPAYLLLSVPSMQTVAESGREVLRTPIAPGSVMKVFALAAALESGAADAETRILCRRTLDVDGHAMTCVHPDLHRGLGPDEALAHSCNVYFATLAKRLQRGALDDVLVRVGLPPSDSAVPLTSVVLGLSGVRATPRAWLEGVVRLAGVTPDAVRLSDRTRHVLRRGLESAVRVGTASALGEAGYSGLAKTGTAPMPGGGYCGIVTAIVNTELPTHAIIVIAPGTSGANAAAMASGILKARGVPPRVRYVAGGVPSPVAGGVPSPVAGGVPSPPSPVLDVALLVRVGHARRSGGYDVAAMPVEDYVAQVVAGEGGDQLPQAAREALAITARTFVERNRGRHTHDGFDVCDLTHCQALRPATVASRAAAQATAGQVLLTGGRIAEVYLSASCGGRAARPSEAWDGAADPAHLPSSPDPACSDGAPWVSDVTEPELRGVLQSVGLRGGRIDTLRVVSRSVSGRAGILSVTGMAPDHLSANVFRMAAGRMLGWNVIKSTLFDVSRTGTGYRFTGSGLGHGVGLCVRGAGARATGGADRHAILAAYFPGTTVGARPPGTELRVVLPEAARHQLPEIRAMLEAELARLSTTLGVPPPASMDVVFHPTVESYRRATSLPWWTAACTRGTRVDLQPLSVLTKRGTVVPTLRHELVHVLVDDVLRDRPLWVREGLALVTAGEIPVAAGERRAPPCPSDAELRSVADARSWREAYAAAGRCVANALARGRSWRNLGARGL